jgi:hypothetical protein
LEIDVGGPSSAEQELQQEQAAQTKQYMEQQSTLFSQQQDLFQTLSPLLQSEINNPVGFTPQELADLNASNVNTTGAQYANVQKQLNLQNASQNMAGLTSGVAAGERASLQGAAAGTLATNAQNTQIASAELAQQKSQAAQSELMALQSGQGGMAVSMGQVENQSQKQAFDQAYQEQQQSSQLMNGILGGLVQTGLGIATGGISGGLNSVLNQGQSFGSGFSAGAFG